VCVCVCVRTFFLHVLLARTVLEIGIQLKNDKTKTTTENRDIIQLIHLIFLFLHTTFITSEEIR